MSTDQDQSMVWQDPPPEKKRRKWGVVAQQLRARPGVWALVGEGISSSAYTVLRSHGCQARTVTRGDGTFDIYARWPES